MIFASILVVQVGAFTIYDCASPTAKYQAVDLTEPEQCREPEGLFGPAEDLQVQVLHTATDRPVKAYNCRVEVTKIATFCGFTSLGYGDTYPVLDQRLFVTPQECRNAVNKGQLRVEGRMFNVTVGAPATHEFFSHGGVSPEGSCQTEAFTTAGVYFPSHYERTIVRTAVSIVRGTLDTDTKEVVFVNGIRAHYPDGVTNDVETGTIVWIPESITCEEEVSEVYHGMAKVYRRRRDDPEQSLTLLGGMVLISKPEDQQFAGLVLRQLTTICNVQAYSTQTRGLTILPLRKGDQPLRQAVFRPQYDTREVHMAGRLGYLHLDAALTEWDRVATLLHAVCKVERVALGARLQAISGGHNPHALLDLYGKGHQIVTAGAVAYVVECAPMEATIAPESASNCTEEIPVSYEGVNGTRTYGYCDPLTFNLVAQPSIIPCNPVMPVQWRIADLWHCTAPGSCATPEQLKLTTGNVTLDGQKDFTRGLGGGTFSSKQLQAHKRFIQVYGSRKAVLTKATVAATLGGQQATGHLGYLLTQGDVDQLTQTIGSALIPMFGWFGKAYTAFIAVAFIGGAVLYVCDALTRAYFLYLNRGMGWWIFGALWHTAYVVVSIPFSVLRGIIRGIKEGRPVPESEQRGPFAWPHNPFHRPDTAQGHQPGKSDGALAIQMDAGAPDPEEGSDDEGGFPEPPRRQQDQRHLRRSTSHQSLRPGDGGDEAGEQGPYRVAQNQLRAVPGLPAIPVVPPLPRLDAGRGPPPSE